MEYETGMIILMVICVAVLLAGAVKSRAEWLMNACMRGILGAVAIYFVNVFLEKKGIFVGVGINPLTVLTSAILGFPGLAALYGLGLYKFL